MTTPDMIEQDMTDENRQQWLTVKQACEQLGLTERTVRRYIKEGKYPSKMEDNRRLVLIDIDGECHQSSTDFHDTVQKNHDVGAHEHDIGEEYHDMNGSSNMITALPSAYDDIQFLRQQLKARDDQMNTLVEELTETRRAAEDASKRSDTLLLQLTQQLQQANVQLEDSRRRVPWWKRIIKRS